MMNAKPILEKELSRMTMEYTYNLGESISIGHGGDFAHADFSTLPTIIEINGYTFELEGGIKEHFHTYRVVGLPSERAVTPLHSTPLPFDELPIQFSGDRGSIRYGHADIFGDTLLGRKA